MAERPILILPKPAAVGRAKLSPGGKGPKPLTPERQQARLGPRLVELEQAFENKRVAMQAIATGWVPEEMLVLETATTVEEFIKAVQKIEGFEFLAEYDEEDLPPDEDFLLKRTMVGERTLRKLDAAYLLLDVVTAVQYKAGVTSPPAEVLSYQERREAA